MNTQRSDVPDGKVALCYLCRQQFGAMRTYHNHRDMEVPFGARQCLPASVAARLK